MSKTVTIPNRMNPFVVMVNGVKYTYPAGSTQEVPDEVAVVIEAHINAHNNPNIPPIEAPFKSASSWEDLGVIGMGDTLEWDGNKNTPKVLIGGSYQKGANYGAFFKVSDVVLTEKDFENDFSVCGFNHWGGHTVTGKEILTITKLKDGSLHIPVPDENGNDVWDVSIICVPEGATYPCGIYFGAEFYDDGTEWRTVSLTIHGCGKFPVTKTVEPEFLPAHLLFGEAEGFSNTLVWNGDTDGLEADPYEQGWYLLSDAVIDLSVLENGLYIEGQTTNGHSIDFFDPNYGLNGNIYTLDTSGDEIVINNMDENGDGDPIVRFTARGVYVRQRIGLKTDGNTGDTVMYVAGMHTLTIPNFNGFPTSVTKTIDKKYLPKAMPIADCWEQNVSGVAFNELLAALREAGYLAK